jgi:hypothetical protein
LFESVLAKVSREVAVVANRASMQLRAERLEAARAAKAAAPAMAATDGSKSEAVSRPRTAKKTTGGLKKDASTRAMGARRQAKRDSR